MAPILLIIGASFAKTIRPIGLTLIIVSVLIVCGAPWLIVYAISGRIKRVEPWLIGVEGVLTTAEVEYYLYSRMPADGEEHRFKESATGSMFAEPEATGRLRKGKSVYQEVLALEQQLKLKKNGEKVFTLVDSLSSTIYYFSARCPPTLCVFMGREGGLGRYVLCSEHCDKGELHKESVLRMPTYLAGYMRPCDWIAIGSPAAVSTAFSKSTQKSKHRPRRFWSKSKGNLIFNLRSDIKIHNKGRNYRKHNCLLWVIWQL